MKTFNELRPLVAILLTSIAATLFELSDMNENILFTEMSKYICLAI